MTETALQIPAETEPDYNLLSNEFMEIKGKADRIATIERKAKDTELTPEETALLSEGPKLYRRGIEISRILRRTNSGPAKVKEKKARAPSKKAAEQAEIDKLFEM